MFSSVYPDVYDVTFQNFYVSDDTYPVIIFFIWPLSINLVIIQRRTLFLRRSMLCT